MIAVIFEVWPKPDQRQTYLDIAASLRPQRAAKLAKSYVEKSDDEEEEEEDISVEEISDDDYED